MKKQAINRREFLKNTSILGGLSAAQVGIISTMWTAHAQASTATPDAVHFLNRTSYGVTARDIATINAVGIEAYLDNQLKLGVSEDAAVDRMARSLYPQAHLSGPAYWSIRLNNYDEITRMREDALNNTLFRALHSKRQLHEIMVGFWSDHLNIYDLAYRIEEQQRVIRPHALGTFANLVKASAHDPAMMIYLHNRDSIKGVPNEDYSRELMELHTLGEGNGYTQTDVIEVARAFTGWGLNDAGAFEFDMSKHDTGAKRVLGVDLPSGRGIQDGEDVLNILLARPECALFVAEKLCKRFVSDIPPISLVRRLESIFAGSSGDIPLLLRELFLSEEFNASKGAKLVRPLEAMVGAYRQWDVHLTERVPTALHGALARAGHTPHSWQTPDGFPANNRFWGNANSLLSCWNFLGGTSYEIVHEDTLFKNIHGSSRASRVVYGDTALGVLIDQIGERLLHTRLDSGIRQVIIEAAGESEFALLDRARCESLAPDIATLVLCSPQNLII